ncbi:MAG: hypothetical protein KatS3mg121_1342 [Gammaproteobacteria bacterium]|nr:MAG: hypothetical protein KatS3mg121_1342 [Gammaproteobacteria bacterium]
MEKLTNAAFWSEALDALLQWALRTVPAIVVVMIATWVALRFSGLLVERFRRFRLEAARQDAPADAAGEAEKRINTLAGILHAALRIGVWTVAAMVVLRTMGIEIGPILAGAGIVGLAVGFGAQELVRDVISGFFILLENQLRTGDVAVINGTGGLVEKIGLRTIILRDFSGVVHVIQNGKIDTLANMTHEWSAAVLDIGVAYKEDVDRVMAIMRRVAEELEQDPTFGPLILEPLEIAGVEAFADSAVVIRARYKTKPMQQWAVAREYRRRLKKAFDEAGVEIPYPHRSLYWGEASRPLAVTLVRGGEGQGS